MQGDDIKIIFIGDIIGKPGRLAVKSLMGSLRDLYAPEFVIVNGENSAHGMGITPDIANFLFNLGIDVITTGNHIWDQKNIMPYIANEARLLRPANYPSLSPGAGFGVFVSSAGNRIGVINLEGRVFMKGLCDSPFVKTREIIDRINRETDAVIVDFHAEATSEKEAFALHFDGEISAVLGTHTHVQTNDETILPKGTAYISDVGMVGSKYSVLGMNKESAINRFLTGIPERFLPEAGNVVLNGVFVSIDGKTKMAREIKKIRINYGEDS